MQTKIVGWNTKKNWFRIISPAVIALVIVFIGIIISIAKMKSSNGWSYLGILIGIPAAAIFLGLDFVVKFFIKNTILVWVTEIVAMGLIYYLWNMRLY